MEARLALRRGTGKACNRSIPTPPTSSRNSPSSSGEGAQCRDSGPKTPVQVARETNLRLPHVSRTLRQLVQADLVRQVGSERRGKLYLPTNLGAAVFGELADARGDRLIAPLARGSHFRNYHHWVVKNFGRNAGDELMVDIGLAPARLDSDGWYPLRTALDALELVESRFGDGTTEAGAPDAAGRGGQFHVPEAARDPCASVSRF